MFGIETSPAVVATLWVLIGFSVATWWLIFLKVWLLWQLKAQNAAFRRAFWEAKDLGEAAKSVATCRGPLARLCQTGLATLDELARGAAGLRHHGGREGALERRLREQLLRERRAFESGLPVFASIGSTAPFVGLFGTVWGIMHALKDIGRAGSASLDVVAGPIGEALVATAIGIAAAVPAVLAYNYSLRRARTVVDEIEDFAADFLRLATAGAKGGK